MKYQTFLLTLLCILLISCQQNPSDFSAEPYIEDDALEMEEGDLLQAPSRPEQETLKNYQSKRKLIKNGSLELEVKQYDAAFKKLEDQLKKHNALLISEKSSNLHDRFSTELNIRVLPSSFEALIKDLQSIASSVHDKSIHTREVTKEYVDLEARLKAKEQVAQRYRDILEKAGSISEVLSVESELRSVIEEIERVKGQLRYLKDQVAMSTLTVTIFEYRTITDIAEAGFFTKLGQSFTFGWNGLQSMILGFVSIWHILVILVITLFAVSRFRKTLKGNHRSVMAKH